MNIPDSTSSVDPIDCYDYVVNNSSSDTESSANNDRDLINSELLNGEASVNNNRDSTNSQPIEQSELRRSTRIRRTPDRYGDYVQH